MSTMPVADHTLRGAIANRQMNRRAWVIVGMLMIYQIINFADKAVLGLVAEPAMQELNLTPTQFGFIGSSFFFLFAIVAVIGGFLAGRVETRWLLLAMGIAWAVLQFPILLGGGAAMLLVTRILLGGAEGPATPISLNHVQGWFAPSERGLPSSLVAAGSTLGPIIAAPILAWIAFNPNLGWRWAFGFLGFVGLAWSIAWLLVGRDGPHSQSAARRRAAQGLARDAVVAEAPVTSLDDDAAATPTAATNPATANATASNAAAANVTAAEVDRESEQRRVNEALGDGRGSVTQVSDILGIVPVKRILGSKMFVVAVLAGAGCFWAQGFLTTWSPKYLSSVVKITPQTMGLVSTFPWLLGAATLLVLGYASRFLMRKGVTVHWALGALFGGTLSISGLCFVLLPFAHGVWAVVLLSFAAGLALIYPLAPTAIAFCVSAKQRGAVMATLTALASFGGVVAPAMVGSFMTSAGYKPVKKGEMSTPENINALLSGMNHSFTLIGIYLLVIGAICLFLLNPDRTAHKLQKFALRG